jgi:hypothetical protein
MDFDLGMAAQLVTASVAAAFGLIKAISSLWAFFRKK